MLPSRLLSRTRSLVLGLHQQTALASQGALSRPAATRRISTLLDSHLIDMHAPGVLAALDADDNLKRFHERSVAWQDTLICDHGGVVEVEEDAAPVRYEDIVDDLQRYLETVPDSMFFLPPDMMFIGPESPCHALRRELLAWPMDTLNNPNNNSGVAVAGSKGVGKSYLLKSATILAGILFPRLSPVYFDLEVFPNSVETPLSDRLAEVLAHTLTARNADGALSAFLEEFTAYKSGNGAPDPLAEVDKLTGCSSALSIVLHHADANDVVFWVVADELRYVYNPRAWAEFSMLLDRVKHSVFVADRSSVLSAMVTADELVLTEDHVLVKACDRKTPLGTLNDTKLTVAPLPGFWRREQVEAFLRGRDIKENVADLAAVFQHTCGGNMRLMRQLIRRFTWRQSDSFKPRPLPSPTVLDPDSVEAQLCHELVATWANSENKAADPLDPFQLPHLTGSEVQAVLNRVALATKKTVSEVTVSLRKSLDSRNGYVSLQHGHSENITFRSSLHMLACMNLHPHVFISVEKESEGHARAFADAVSVLGLEPLLYMRTSPEAIDAVATPPHSPTKSWEQWMKAMVKTGHYGSVVVILSPEYAKKAKDSKNGGGVYLEWTALLKEREEAENTGAEFRVCFGHVGDWDAEYLKLASMLDPTITERDHIVDLRHGVSSQLALAKALLPWTSQMQTLVEHFVKYSHPTM